MISWINLSAIIVVSVTLFVILSIRGSKFGVAMSTAIFTFVLTAILVAMKMTLQKSEKEEFFFKASPHKRCSNKGMIGRPLTFDYELPDCKTCI